MTRTRTQPRIIPAPSVPVPSGPSFGQTMKEGFALGAGQAIAHRVVGSFFSSPPSAAPPAATKHSIQEQAWFQCLKENNFSQNSQEYCAHLKPKAVDVEKP